MAILSTILAVAEPNGMWESIIKGLEAGIGSYIIAIILLTIIIRIIWAPFDTINKKMSSKMTSSQAKMQPELDRLQKKYANDPQLLKQKQNELYKKYQTGSMGSCLFMLVFMGLNLAIFLTLWQGLNAMSIYKTSENYENLKNEYANCLSITDNYLKSHSDEVFKDYQDLVFQISESEGKQFISLKKKDDVLFTQEYVKNFEVKEGEEVKVSHNANIANLIGKYIRQLPKQEKPETPDETETQPLAELETPEFSEVEYIGGKVLIEEVKEGDVVVTPKVTLSDAVQNIAMKAVITKYKLTQDKFLWIQNIWVADSPLQKSIPDYAGYEASINKANVGENEQFIYESFMTPLKEKEDRVNGYFILPVLCVLIFFLAMYLTNRQTRKNSPAQPKSGKAIMFIMPVIFGVFAIFYSSVFAIYMLVGQLVSAALMPLENLIVKKWNDHSSKKKQEKEVEVVDYRRKF